MSENYPRWRKANPEDPHVKALTKALTEAAGGCEPTAIIWDGVNSPCNVFVFFDEHPSLDDAYYRGQQPIRTNLGTHLVAQIVAQLWPAAHILWSPCSCCCGINDFRKNYPDFEYVPARVAS